MKKKLLFMLINMNIGGTERSFLNLLYTLDPNEYDVTLMLLENRGGFMDDIPSWVNVRILEGYESIKPEILEPPLTVAANYLKSGNIRKVLGIAGNHLVYKLTKDRTGYFRYVLKDLNDSDDEYDIAIAYAGPMDFITTYILEHIHAKEKVQWIHFDVSRIGFNVEFVRRNYPRFNRVYVVSDAAKEQLLNIVPEIQGITETRHNIVSKELCYKEAETGSGFTDAFYGTRILTVGRLSEEKGQIIIPETAKRLKDEGYQFRWYLIGSGKTENGIRTKINEYGLENDVVLLGTIKNPFPFYAQCDLYVQTSLHEGYCISLAEAQAFGKPIVSTDVAGAKDLLQDPVKEIRVRFDAGELSAGIKHIINTEELKQEAMI